MSAVQSHYGESHVRAKFQEYVARFVRLSAAYEEEVYHHSKLSWPYDPQNDPTGLLGHGHVFPDEATKQRELTLNANRIEAWRKTISYRNLQKVVLGYARRDGSHVCSWLEIFIRDSNYGSIIQV